MSPARGRLPVRCRALLLLALLLSGCVAGPASVRETRLAGSAELPVGCLGGDCAHEWWNLTVDGVGAYSLRVPIPSVAPEPPFLSPWRDPYPWAANLTVEGKGAAMVQVGKDVAEVALWGEGPLKVTSHRIRLAGPAGRAEEYLHASWGPQSNQTYPDVLATRSEGRVGFHLEYDAVSARCTRAAMFGAPIAIGDARGAPGRDGAKCK